MTGTAPAETGYPAALDRAIDDFLADVAARPGPAADVWGRQFDAGLAWVDFPVGLGGLGLPRELRAGVATRLTGAGIPDAASSNGVAISLVAPVLISHGRPDQQQHYLRSLFTGDDIWCQLFSEPGAGSDLAGLATRAERTDAGYVVNGQKVWTTLGHVARWGLLCARTDPDKPKHAGLSMYVLDMAAPGVEVRPIRQITGDADFNEVFLQDVLVPADALIGAEGDGWSGILATLANERAAFAATPLPREGGVIGEAVALWAERGPDHPELQDRYLQLWVRAEAIRLAELAAIESEKSGTPSSSWSYLKLQRSELEQSVYDLCMSLLGIDGLGYSSYEMRQPKTMDDLQQDMDVPRKYLYARSATIAGGTSEIQRTIIADRVLRLPREPQTDRAVPWRQIRHS